LAMSTLLTTFANGNLRSGYARWLRALMRFFASAFPSLVLDRFTSR
jgi:hypothetical protein